MNYSKATLISTIGILKAPFALEPWAHILHCAISILLQLLVVAGRVFIFCTFPISVPLVAYFLMRMHRRLMERFVAGFTVAAE